MVNVDVVVVVGVVMMAVVLVMACSLRRHGVGCWVVVMLVGMMAVVVMLVACSLRRHGEGSWVVVVARAMVARVMDDGGGEVMVCMSSEWDRWKFWNLWKWRFCREEYPCVGRSTSPRWFVRNPWVK